jgi:hypothetical protein
MFNNYNGSTEGVEGKVNEIKNGYNILLQIKNKERTASPPFFKQLIENIEARLVDIMNIAFPPTGQLASRADQLWLFAHRKEIETALPIFKELRSEYKIPWEDAQEIAFNAMLGSLSIERIYTDDYKAGGELAQKAAYGVGTAATFTAVGTGARLGGLPIASAALLVGCTGTLIGGRYAKRYGAGVAAQVAENINRSHFGLAPTT